jgi:iron complex outermembrane receptor protein
MKAGRAAPCCGTAMIILALIPFTSAAAQTVSGPSNGSAPEADVQSADIVVTAQKRSERLQDIPLSVTAADAQRVANAALTTPERLEYVAPAVRVAYQSGAPFISIRGIGTAVTSPGTDPSVAFHLNGVYVPRLRAEQVGFFDVERVEVVRGPQGTLYGRNATGGVVNVISKQPTNELSLDATAEAGNYGFRRLEAGIGGAIIDDKLLVRAAGIYVRRDGFGRNFTTNSDVNDLAEQGARLTLQFKPNSSLKFTLEGDLYGKHDRSGYSLYLGQGRTADPVTGIACPASVYNAGFTCVFPGLPASAFRGGFVPALGRFSVYQIGLGATLPSTDYGSYASRDNRLNSSTKRLAFTAEADLGGGFNLTSITGYHRFKFSEFADVDQSNLSVLDRFTDENSRDYSSELRLSYSRRGIDAVVGGYYFNEEITGGLRIPFYYTEYLFTFLPPGLRPTDDASVNAQRRELDQQGRIRTEAWAVFGQATVEVASGLKITLGGRYSGEVKRADGNDYLYASPTLTGTENTPFDNRRSFHAFTPRASINYKFAPDISVYASYSRGFKSGVYVLGQSAQAVAPEFVNSYEVGLKSQFWNRRVTFNLTGFYYDYKDLQVQVFNGLFPVTQNASNARVYGLEGELSVRPTSTTRLGASLSLLHGTYRDYFSSNPSDPDKGVQDLSGRKLTNTPSYQFDFNASQDVSLGSVGALTFYGDVSRSGKVYFTPWNEQAASQAAYWNVDARLTFRPANNPNVTVSGWVKNLTDEHVVAGALISNFQTGYPVLGSLRDPRTYGVTLGLKF